MGLLTFKKVAGSSLVEVTVSMVILVMILGITLTIYINLTNSGLSLQQVRSELLMKDYIQQSKLQQTFFNDQTYQGNLVLDKVVESYRGNPELLILIVTVTDKRTKRIVCRHQELIYNPYAED